MYFNVIRRLLRGAMFITITISRIIYCKIEKFLLTSNCDKLKTKIVKIRS